MRLRLLASVVAPFVLVTALCPSVLAETSGKSAEECRKVVPGNWGPNFSEEWHQNEAVFWSCRLGITVELVKKWQHTAEISGMIQDIVPVKLQGEEIVLISEVEGSMRCFTFSALKKSSTDWQRVWQESSDNFCVMSCPPIEMRVSGSVLTLYVQASSNAACKGLFKKAEYVWDGMSFRASSSRSGSMAKP